MPQAEPDMLSAPDGTSLAVHTLGDGPPLLLVHGTACDHTVWVRVARRLKDAFRVHMVDRRGRGASRDTPPYSLGKEIDDIAAVTDAIQEDTGHLVGLIGHSMGGVLALEAAAQTEGVGRVVAHEPPIYGEDQAVREAVEAIEQLLETDGPEAVAEAFLARVGYSEASLERLKGHGEAWRSTVDAGPTIPRESRALLEYELDAFGLRKVAVPVLLSVGSNSPPMYRDGIARVKSRIDHASVRVIDGVGHSPHTQAPGRFAQALASFLEDA